MTDLRHLHVSRGLRRVATLRVPGQLTPVTFVDMGLTVIFPKVPDNPVTIFVQTSFFCLFVFSFYYH